MARQSTQTQVLWAVLGFLATGTLCGLWVYSDIRTTEATVDAIRASERALDRIAAPEPSFTSPPSPVKAPPRADQAARDSASHACVADGLGPLKIERIAVHGDRWDVTGTAGKRRVVVHLREFTGPRGSATFRVQHVERL